MARKSTSGGGRIHTPTGIAAYVNLFTPRQRTDRKGNPQGEPKYGLALFFRRDQEDELQEMMDLAEAKLKEAFGPKAMDLVRKGKINWPFSDTEDMDEPSAPFDQPGWAVNFKTSDKPGIVDAEAEPIMDKSEVYSGMEARVSCRCFTYDNESKGVAYALVNVQKIDDGERMSGNPSAEDDFGAASGGGKRKPAARGKRDQDEDNEEDERPARGRAPAKKGGGKYGGLI